LKVLETAIDQRAKELNNQGAMSVDWQLHTDFHTIDLISGDVYHYRSGICDTRNNKGYIVIQLNNCQVPAHKFIFEQFWGYMPSIGQQIDHIDRNIKNNSIFNLRCVTLAQQAQNKGLRKDNKGGCPGVYVVGKRKDRYRAEIQANGIIYRLGTFCTFEEAVDARNRKAIELNKELGTCFNLFPPQRENFTPISADNNNSVINSQDVSFSSNNLPSTNTEQVVDIDLTLDSDDHESFMDVDKEVIKQSISAEAEHHKFPHEMDNIDQFKAGHDGLQHKRKHSLLKENTPNPEHRKKIKYEMTDLRYWFRSKSDD
jgi:hypothetical protein